MQPDLVVRQAVSTDLTAITALLETTPHIHRHLDWRPPLEWLGRQPFWLVEQNGLILAALACPPDPPGVAWIRLLAVHPSLAVQTAWEMLFPKSQAYDQNQASPVMASIVLYPWFGDLLKNAGFHLHQEIVVLEWDNTLPTPVSTLPQISIRNIDPADLPQVARVDNLAFEPLWQNSQESLAFALQQSACATVAEVDGNIVGYQISTASAYSAHLARLAVLPAMQKRSIGYLLVQDLLERFSHQDLYRVTVNTQDNNRASLALYQKLGFWLTGDRFQVLIYPFH
jgi:ribosomal protein S18 acetylase RimI-like enzyme